jgi:hypothetical protein
MPLFGYVLLALLGSTGVTTPGGTLNRALPRTLTANAITQPSGAAEGEAANSQRNRTWHGRTWHGASKPFVRGQGRGRIESSRRGPMPPVPMSRRSPRRRR